MNWNEKDYEVVAAFLDGQRVPLSDAQRELARQVTEDSHVVGRRLDVAVPAGVMHRVNGRLPVMSQRRPLRRGLYIGLAASAAAVVLLAVTVRFHMSGARNDAITPDQYIEAFLSDGSEEQAQAQELSDEISVRQDEWASNSENFERESLEQELKDLEQRLDSTE